MPAPPLGGGDTAVAIAFLQGYLPQGPWTIVHDREASGGVGGWPAAQFWPGQETALAEAIEANQGRNNLYFVVNLPVTDHPLRTSPAEEEMVAYLAVPLDIDLPADATAEQLEDVIASVRTVTPLATAIIFSGGGVQGFWVFDGPQPLARAAEVERQTVALADALGGDHVQNINRLMRLPGTINVLNAVKRAAGRTPAAAYVIEADWSRRYSLDAPLATPRAPAARWSLTALEKVWRERITTGNTDWLNGADRTKSAAVFGITCYLVRSGWPDEAIVALFTNPANGASQHVLSQANPANYALKQARDARGLIAREFIRSDKGAIIADNYENVKKGFVALGTQLTYDSFADRLLYVNGAMRASTFGDNELKTYRVRRFAEELKFRPSKDYFADTVATIAYEKTFHPVVDYLAPLAWDNTPRLETWLITLAGAADTPYVRAVSRLILIAAVARVREPGRKFDEMLVFESPQGKDKSTALRVLAVNEDWFGDSLSLAATSQQAIEQLAGKWLIEAADLSGMRKSDVETLKAFLSRQTDRARLAYGRFPVERPRSCVFFGTTNSTRYLRDEANRRFWPVKVRAFDTAALLTIRDQLWAEAAAAHTAGESIRLNPDLYDVAAAEQRLRRVEDPWVEMLESVLGNKTGRILTIDTFEIIGRPEGQRLQDDNRRIGEAMRELGWDRVRTTAHRAEGPRWFYMRGDAEARRRDLYILRDPFGAISRDTLTGSVRVVDAEELRERGITPAAEGSLPLDNEVPS
jgi:hypothetical protein